MKKKNIALITLCLWISGNLAAKEYHVSPQGSDADAGTLTQPFRTINRAAQLALPGDTVTVHEGVYREWVNPLYGGESNDKRILYRAAPGEKAELKGSEVITGWKSDKRAKGVWRAVVSNKMFGNYNPFNDELFGDWLWKPEGTTFHTGEVYLNDVSLYEAQNIEKVLHPDTIRTIRDPQGSTAFWYAEVGAEETTIYANFGAANPNKEIVEITVRPTCFYPTREGLNYITFRGFHVSQAATQWAAPTAEQVGMVSTHWCKGWIIEENIIKNSRANGITLGKERGSGHNLDCTDKRLDGTHHYIEVIFNVLRHGWEKNQVGSHIVRNNTISDCEQTGICGSMGGAFSEIYGNHIYNILCKQQYGGAEMAGIKLHGAIDTYIHNNRIHKCGCYGLWLDWMAQGARVSSNLFYDNSWYDLFTEVQHGPIIVDNNILLSQSSVQENADGIAYVHNLFAGCFRGMDDERYVPYHLNHSTEIKGFKSIVHGDHRFYNNIFMGGKNNKAQYGLKGYQTASWPIFAEGNLFCNNAQPAKEGQGEVLSVTVPEIQIEETANEVYLILPDETNHLSEITTQPVDAARLGKARLSNYCFENPDGTPVNLGKDYFGKIRSGHFTTGPIQQINEKRIKVW